MSIVSLREPNREDKIAFLEMTQRSTHFHTPWVEPPRTEQEFNAYLERHQLSNQKSFLVLIEQKTIVGVFNLNEIVRGCFQSAYLGFYSAAEFAGKGWMSKGLKLILQHAFTEMGLHRLEANIQPPNTPSLHLVKKNGFSQEGFSPRYLKIDKVWRDHERWAITIEDWQNGLKNTSEQEC